MTTKVRFFAGFGTTERKTYWFGLEFFGVERKTYWFGLDFFGVERFEELRRPLQLQALLRDSEVAHAVLSSTKRAPTLASAPHINPDVTHTHTHTFSHHRHHQRLFLTSGFFRLRSAAALLFLTLVASSLTSASARVCVCV